MKKFARFAGLCLAAVLMALSAVSCVSIPGLTQSEPQTFDEQGYSITLPGGFEKQETPEGLTYYFLSRDAIVTALKEDFTTLSSIGLSEQSTLQDYAEAVQSANSAVSPSEITTSSEGVTYFTYQNTVDGEEYFYLATVHKGPEAFWLCNFACMLNQKDTMTDQFLEWAQTITVS